jgi:hypothetical protein
MIVEERCAVKLLFVAEFWFSSESIMRVNSLIIYSIRLIMSSYSPGGYDYGSVYHKLFNTFDVECYWNE